MHPTSEDENVSTEMPRYRSHKQVWALKIASVDGYKLAFAEVGYAPITVEPNMFARYTPVPGDYYVVYDDGYKSISPAKPFEDGYTLLDRAGAMHRAFNEAEAAVERKTKL